MLTALLSLMLVTLPFPGKTPTALPFFGGADGPDAAGYVIVPAETTGYAWASSGSPVVVRGDLRYGYVYYHRGSSYYAGFLLFELSAIPERTVISSLEMDYYQFDYSNYQPAVSVHTFSYHRWLRGDEMINRIAGGLQVASQQVSVNGWNRFTLWHTGRAAVDSCRQHEEWLSLGISQRSEGVGYACGFDVPEYRPYLRIGYLTAYPDVGTAMLIEPADTVVTGVAITPRALVRNHSADTLSFPVRFTIGTDYSSETTMTLEPGTEDMVGFAPWIPQDTGRFEVKCSTMLDGDEDPTNDRLTDTVVVINPGGIGDSPMPVSATRFALYPNPARNRVWLESPENSTLYGPDGRRVAVLQPGENSLRELSQGVYFARRPGGGRFTRLVLVR